MSHITDEHVIRAMTAGALLELKEPLTVPRGEGYARRLCSQLDIKGVDRGLVCKAMKDFVANGFVGQERASVYALGSGPDPIALPARRLSVFTA